jgi:hypothetical protein
MRLTDCVAMLQVEQWQCVSSMASQQGSDHQWSGLLASRFLLWNVSCPEQLSCSKTYNRAERGTGNESATDSIQCWIGTMLVTNGRQKGLTRVDKAATLK